MKAPLAHLVYAVLVVGCAESRSRPVPDAGHDAGETFLPDGIAGRACKRDSDCESGRCAKRLAIANEDSSMPAPGGYCTVGCTRDAHCGKGGACSVPAGADSGECLGHCRAASDCRDGYVCVGGGSGLGVSLPGTCQPMPRTGRLADGVAGLSCVGDADCEGGRCAAASPVGKAFPGNYCTGRCLRDEECGLGGACLSVAGSADAGYCYETCQADRDCARAGYRCVRLREDFSACYPAPESLADDVAGQACESDRDCGGGSAGCAIELPFKNASFEVGPAPGGYCTQECSVDAECGASGQCISRGAQGGMCLRRCELPSDCRAGYSCIPHGRDLNLTDRVCMPFES